MATIFFCAIYLHTSAEKLLRFGKMNLICTLIAKVFLYGLCKALFFSRKNKIMSILYEKYEFLVLIVLNFILEILTASVLRNKAMKIAVPMDVLFLSVQVMLLGNFIYILCILHRKDRKLAEANKELERLDHVVRVTEKLKEVQHDVKVHAIVLASLLEDENYCEAKRYLSNIAWDLKQVKKVSSVSDLALASVLSQFVEESEGKGIQFYRHILVQDFYISSRDLCLMVSNMLQNAKEATERLIQERRYISLDIFPVEGGYRITCMNPYGEKNVCYRTTKQDRKNHGLGLKIIKAAAERNGGAMEIIPNQIHWFEITCFIPVPKL
jgi:signal transduction histidine kinase